MNYCEFAATNARQQASEVIGGLSPIRSETLLDDPKCTCPGFHKDGVWFPMVFDKDCPLQGSPNNMLTVSGERKGGSNQ